MKYTKILLVAISLLIISGAIHAQGAYTVAYLSFFPDAFKAGMEELGYVEGENVNYRLLDLADVPPEEYVEQFNLQVEAIVAEGVDVIVVNTDTDAVNISSMTGDIPIVFGRSDDPVATGAVADLVTPGGNMTGTITNRPHERRLQILTEIYPETDAVYYLYSTLTGEAETVREQVEAVGEELGVEVVPAPITDVESALMLLENTPEEVDWLFLTPFVPFDPQFTETLVAVSMERQIGITWVTDDAFPGYLMGYGPSIQASEAQAAQIVDRILRGASPADLPVQTAENYLMINLEAAAQINLEIPEGILRQANLIVRPGYFDNWEMNFGG
ncbi:MAG TPA: ABC transporter substrate-binding protein [Oceanobacillus sp.]|nr:ABC transporter substrate-binding protein [Oceanobacillus sp.]